MENTNTNPEVTTTPVENQPKKVRLTYAERLEMLVEAMSTESEPARELFLRAFTPETAVTLHGKPTTHFGALCDIDSLQAEEGVQHMVRVKHGKTVFVHVKDEESRAALLEILEDAKKKDVEPRKRPSTEEKAARKAAAKAEKAAKAEAEVLAAPVAPVEVPTVESDNFFEAQLNALDNE